MSSFLQKAAPFFEHIVIGVAFAAVGYSFFWTFNNTSNLFSILGMAGVCFGGLKILIGVIIYGGWLAALIFRPDYLKKKEEEERELERKKKEAAATEIEENKSWFVKNMPFVARYWGIILEISLLAIGVLVILITKGGV